MGIQSMGGIVSGQMKTDFDYHDISEPTDPQTIGMTIVGPASILRITGTVVTSGLLTPQGKSIPVGSLFEIDCVNGIFWDAPPGVALSVITGSLGNLCNIGRVILFGPASVLGAKYTAVVPRSSIPIPTKGQQGAINWSSEYRA